MTDPATEPAPMQGKRQTVILCEGYHDRAFWKKALQIVGCTSAVTSRTIPRDPWGKPVDRGHFAFASRGGGEFIRVVPSKGRPNLRPLADVFLKGRSTEALSRLVINHDRDESQSSQPAREWVDFLRRHDAAAALQQDGMTVILDDGRLPIHVIDWHSPHERAPGTAREQNIERLVTAAIVRAYPERGEAVQRWLDARPSPPAASSSKEYSWSHMAGWYADQHCEAFYERVWDDERIADVLRDDLRKSGIWSVVESVASASG